MIFVKSVKNAGGYDNNNNLYAIMELICDNESDLPQPDYFISKKYIIAQSSTAEIIGTGAKFEMQSSGNWILKVAGTATYTKSEIDTMLSQIDILRQGTEISENANLNDFVEIGAYYSPNSARTATLTNCPWTGSGFKLIVFSISTTSKMHVLMPISNSADCIFFRSRISSGFRPWYKIRGTAV